MQTTRLLLGSLTALLLATVATGCSALRVFFPSDHHDEIAPELPPQLARPAILVFSKTNGFINGMRDSLLWDGNAITGTDGLTL